MRRRPITKLYRIISIRSISTKTYNVVNTVGNTVSLLKHKYKVI